MLDARQHVDNKGMQLLEVGDHHVNLDRARKVIVRSSSSVLLEFDDGEQLPVDGDPAIALLKHMEDTKQFVPIPEPPLSDAERFA